MRVDQRMTQEWTSSSQRNESKEQDEWCVKKEKEEEEVSIGLVLESWKIVGCTRNLLGAQSNSQGELFQWGQLLPASHSLLPVPHGNFKTIWMGKHAFECFFLFFLHLTKATNKWL